jgi:hypothetical protein
MGRLRNDVLDSSRDSSGSCLSHARGLIGPSETEDEDMPSKISCFAAFGLSLFCLQSLAQNVEEWSLDPITTRFPCDNVRLTTTSFTFVKSMKITCNGKQYLNPQPGSSYAVSYACDRTSGVILLDEAAMQKHPNHLLQVIRRDCSR